MVFVRRRLSGILHRMSVNLSYTFDPAIAESAGEIGVQLDHPLFVMLAAIQEEGSIGRAAVRLGLSYRHLWGQLKQRESVFGAPLLDGRAGQSAVLSDLGRRLLAAERRMLARHLPTAEALAAKIDNELLMAVQPGLKPVSMCTSHDFLIASLREGVRERSAFLLDVEYQGSAKALTRLNDGECQLAGMHLPLDQPEFCQRGSGLHLRLGRLLRLGEHKLIRLANRQQGLIVAPGNPLGIASVRDVARRDVTFVNRRSGSGTRLLLDELLAFHGMSMGDVRCYGHEEPNHLSVAAAVVAGLGNCALGLKAAATRFNLDFVPLLSESFFVVCRKEAFDSESVQAVIAELASERFREAAGALPGYSADEAGQVISLRRNLPWYR